MQRVYAEVGFGNGTFFSTEFEESEREYRVPKFVRPENVVDVYLRIWIGKTMLVLSSREGLKVKKKNRRMFKFLLGIGGTARTNLGHPMS